MELNLHPIAIKCFVSGREFAEDDRVVCYLAREATGEIVRRDLLESEDGRFMPPAFVYCRWVVGFKPRRAEENPALTLKLTAENLFLTLALPAGSDPAVTVQGSGSALLAPSSTLNVPLLQFLTLMLERKKLIKHRGRTEDGERHLYEHMPSHQFYEVPVGDLNQEFFQKIQEHLGVLVGTPKPKAATSAPASAEAPVAPVAN
jgi:hypothetical protein